MKHDQNILCNWCAIQENTSKQYNVTLYNIKKKIPSLQTPLAEQSLGQTSCPILSTIDVSSVSFLMWYFSYFLIWSKQNLFKDSKVYFENSVVPLS